MVKWLLPVLLVGCVTEGNEISGSWTPARGGLLSGAEEGECIGDVRIDVRAGSTTTRTTDCGDGGFDLVVPTEARHATIVVRDDWSDTITFDLVIDGDTDVGPIYFQHFGDSD